MTQTSQPLPDTQEAKDVFSISQEEAAPTAPWGFLCALKAHISTTALTKSEYSVGRAPTCDITLSREGNIDVFSALSKIHFTIKEDNKAVMLTDCSSNGTFVNSEKVGQNNKILLQNNDLISLAKPQYTVYVFLNFLAGGDETFPPEMRKQYLVSRVLGKGAFGEVKLVFNRRTFAAFAMKCVDKKYINFQSNGSCRVNEVEILRSLHHSFIIEYQNIVETPDKVFMLLEFMEGGDLHKKIITMKSLCENDAKWYLHQIVLAVAYLHSQNIAHRDLKPANILLSSHAPDAIAKVSDFGLSRFCSSHTPMKTKCGTRMFTAPEVLETQGMGAYSKGVDVWGIGVILYMCLSGRAPFNSTDPNVPMEYQIITGEYSFPSEYWGNVSSNAQDAVKRMMTVDPKKRICVENITKLAWFQDEAMVRRIRALLNRAGDENVPPCKRQRSNNSETLTSSLTSTLTT